MHGAILWECYIYVCLLLNMKVDTCLLMKIQKQKDNVGKLWASRSGNVFLLASVDLNGKDFFDQINEAIA